jgi:hypothetical protein
MNLNKIEKNKPKKIINQINFPSLLKSNVKLQIENSKEEIKEIKQETKVVKLKRKNGIIIQDCDVYIGRSCFMGGWKLQKSK